MGWFSWLVIIFFILWLIGKTITKTEKPIQNKRVAQENRNTFSETKKVKNVFVEAKEIADKIVTIKQFKSLEKKLETAEDRISNAETERAYENASHKYEVLQEALDIAQSKTFLWQFIPTVDLGTPKEILELSYKTYTKSEYNELKKTIVNSTSDWYEIDGYGEKEEPEPYIKSLIKFREIIDSNINNEEKSKKINQLVSSNKTLAEEFFDTEDALSAGDQWFAESMSIDGLPLAFELYHEGYTTPEKCLDINLEEFSKRKGVGPKKLAQLKEYQLNVKNKLQNA